MTSSDSAASPVTIRTFGMTALLPDDGGGTKVLCGFPLSLFRYVVPL